MEDDESKNCVFSPELAASGSSLLTVVERGSDVKGLWDGIDDMEEESTLFGNITSGGALLKSGHWTYSDAAPSGVQWTAIGRDELTDPWANHDGRYKSESARSGGDFKDNASVPFLPVKVELGGSSVQPWNSTSENESTAHDAKLPLSPTSPRKLANSPSSSSTATRTRSAEAPKSTTPGVKSRPIRVTARSPLPCSIVKSEDEDQDDEDEEGVDDTEPSSKKRSWNHSRQGAGFGSELSEKRRRNREHAKRSRMRKRVRLGGLEEAVLELRRENVRLRQIVKQGIPDRADDIIRTCASDNTDADLVDKQDVVQGMRPGMTTNSLAAGWGTRTSERVRNNARVEGGGRKPSSRDLRVPSALKLMSPSYQSVTALAESQANFILTNPNLPDCPIIFASPGFMDLTGYDASDVIGKNCRFLQGAGTDPVTVSIIRNNLTDGRDTSVCILNYKADGTPFWNQLSIGVLLDSHGRVANHVGVLCEVKQMPPADFHRLLHRVPLPESLLVDDSDSGDDLSDGCGRAQSNVRSTSLVDRQESNSPAAPKTVDRLRRTRASSSAR
uniref:Putative LOV domain-containing protein n=1 Tax=Ishige okamurae TaxID=233772 RepID=A0A126WV95_9PHAE|nr:putative LOV domain-containing protein [Ishige okamurae]